MDKFSRRLIFADQEFKFFARIKFRDLWFPKFSPGLNFAKMAKNRENRCNNTTLSGTKGAPIRMFFLCYYVCVCVINGIFERSLTFHYFKGKSIFKNNSAVAEVQ